MCCRCCLSLLFVVVVVVVVVVGFSVLLSMLLLVLFLGRSRMNPSELIASWSRYCCKVVRGHVTRTNSRTPAVEEQGANQEKHVFEHEIPGTNTIGVDIYVYQCAVGEPEKGAVLFFSLCPLAGCMHACHDIYTPCLVNVRDNMC